MCICHVMNSASYLELAFSTLFQVLSWNSRLRIGTEQTILSRNPNPYTDNSCALTMLIAQNLANCTFFCPHGNLIHLPMESMIAFILGTMTEDPLKAVSSFRLVPYPQTKVSHCFTE